MRLNRGLMTVPVVGEAPSSPAPSIIDVVADSVDNAMLVMNSPTCSSGDLLFALWCSEGTARTPTLPSGWSWILASPYTGSITKYAALTKTANSTDASGTTYNFELTDYGVEHAVAILSITNCSGVSTVTPTNITVNNTSFSGPSVTPGQANNLLLHCSTWRGTPTTYTKPSSPGTWTQIVVEESPTRASVAISSAPYDSTDATGAISATLGTARQGSAWTICCNPN